MSRRHSSDPLGVKNEGLGRTQYLAIDVGGSAIKHALVDADYQLSDKGSVPSAGLSSTAEFIEALGAIHDQHRGRVAGIAVSTCGELDPASGHMFSGGMLRFNKDINLVDLLQARCGVPVSVENDANCALLAELHDGALTDATNGVVLVLGSAVGGALMLNRRIYHGSHFHSGNASLTMLVLTEPYDIDRILAWHGGVGGLTGPLARRKGWDPAAVDGARAFDLAEAGDADALAALDSYCALLAAFVFNTHVMLDVDVVAVGGGISARPILIDTLRGQVDGLFNATPASVPRPEIRGCRHRNDANLLGAVYHHLHSGQQPSNSAGE